MKTTEYSDKILDKKNFNVMKKNYGIKGTYGDVHCCIHIPTSHIYIDKILKWDCVSLKEAEIYISMNHKNIGKCIGYYKDNFNVHIISEKYNPTDLYDLIEQNFNLPKNTSMIEKEKTIKSYVKQLLKGLQYIHKKNIIHGDLKLSNILVHEKVIKIIDFGCARYSTENDLTDLLGSIGYFAPEILFGKIFQSSDMWSLGCIVFIFFFKYNPFNKTSKFDFEEITKNISKGFNPDVLDGYGPHFPKDIPISADARDFISNLLILNPEYRLNVDECLSHKWLL